MTIETAFILLFVVATAVAIATRWVRLPYTVALVLAGLALGGLRWFPAPHLSKDLFFSVFLPGLIFEAAFHTDSREFRDNWMTILTLAVPGVVASIALITFTLTPVIADLRLAPGFIWPHALVFGSLIAATDPVAVVALFRNMGAPRRLTTLLDGESLLNDGTAIVFFTLSLALVAGSTVTASGLALRFVAIVGGGVIVGAAIGAVALWLMRQVDDPMIAITLTTIVAYGSFLSAEQLGASGVIATVTAGMLCGSPGARSAMSASTRVAAETFWEYVTFALNSIVFLLIGFEVHLSALGSYWLPILLAYLVVTIGRGLVIAGGRALLGRSRERFPWRWGAVLTWGGLRGALPMVLALSLPRQFPHRELIVSMTFGVAVLSILVHGVTMSTVLRRLGIVSEPADRIAYEVRSGRLEAAAAALRELERVAQMRMAAPEILQSLRVQYRRAVENAERELEKLNVPDKQFLERDLYLIHRRLLAVERNQVMQAFRRGALGQESQQRLLADIDARLLSLESGQAGAAGTAREPESGSRGKPDARLEVESRPIPQHHEPEGDASHGKPMDRR